MNNLKNIQGVVLAAGSSRRFGRDKTLVYINDLPMAIKTALSLKSVVENVFIVINENNTALQEMALKFGIKYVVNKTEVNSGIGSSISLAVKSSSRAEGWIFCLADMPFIQINTYDMVLSALNESGSDSIVIPRFNGKSGHPVGFGQSFCDSLLRKTGDVGAKTIIQNQLNNITYIETDDSAVLVDIDTELDLIKNMQ